MEMKVEQIPGRVGDVYVLFRLEPSEIQKIIEDNEIIDILEELNNLFNAHFPTYRALKTPVPRNSPKWRIQYRAHRNIKLHFKALKLAIMGRIENLYSVKLAKHHGLKINDYVYRSSHKFFNQRHLETSNFRKQDLQAKSLYETFKRLHLADEKEISNLNDLGTCYQISYIDISKLREDIEKKQAAAN